MKCMKQNCPYYSTSTLTPVCKLNCLHLNDVCKIENELAKLETYVEKLRDLKVRIELADLFKVVKEG